MISADDFADHVKGLLKRANTQLEGATSEGQVEAVHQFRVASRRLNEPLLLMNAWERDKEVRRARRRIRRLRRAFRRVRDLDVLLIHLGEAGTRDVLDPTELAQLEGLLTQRRQRLLGRAVRRASRIGPDAALGTVRRKLDELRKRSRGALSEHALTDLVRKRTTALLRFDPSVDEAVNLHDLRLRLKRFRYCAELEGALTGTERDDLLRAAKEMQDRLGYWSDQLVAARCFAGLARRNRHLARQTVWAGHMLEYAAKWVWAAEEERRELIRAWPALRDAVRAVMYGEPGARGTPSQSAAESR